MHPRYHYDLEPGRKHSKYVTAAYNSLFFTPRWVLMSSDCGHGQSTLCGFDM
jgi:hypothetical protein